MKHNKSLIILLQIIRKKAEIYASIMACITITVILNAYVYPEVLRKLFSAAMNKQNILSVITAFLVISLAGVGIGVIRSLLKFAFSKYSHNSFEDAIMDYYGKVKYWNTKIKDNDALDRIKHTAYSLVDEFYGFVEAVIGSLLTIAVSTIYVITLNPILFIVCIGIDLLMIYLSRRKIAQLSETQKDLNEANKDVYSATWEQINNLEIARYLNRERVLNGYHRSIDNYSSRLLAWKKNGNWLALFNQFGGIIMVLVVVLIDSIFALYGAINFDEIFALATVIPTLTGALFSLPNLLGDYKKIQAYFVRVNGLWELEQDEGDGEEIKEKIDSLTITGLSFSYSEESRVLDNLTLDISGRQFTCITGTSGCGKSTLLKLCAKLLPYEEDHVKWNGKELVSVNRNLLWRRLGYLGQEHQILPGSLLFNITLGRERDNHQKRLEFALTQADLPDLIGTLALGVDTIVDQEKLSNGEKQKLCFARLFYHDYDVWLLDESTSALDPASELVVLSNIREYIRQNEIMVIMVSHRKQVLDNVDRIIYLQNGTIAREKGVG